MIIRLFKDDDRERWDRYVMESSISTFYHLIGWKNVVEKTFGHKTFYLLAENQGEIYGILPLVLIKSNLFGRFLVSMPFLNYGGICASTIDAEIGLLEKAIEIAKKERVKYLELRQYMKLNSDLPYKENKVTTFVSLGDRLETIWERLDGQRRREVRKAERSGLKIKIGGREDLESFYDVLIRNMRDLGTPLHSIQFFENILLEFPESIKIFSVILKDKVISGALAGFFKDTAEGLWFSSNKEYSKFFPSEFSYWHQLKYACENGYSYFNLGRSTKNSGSQRFKHKFNGETRQLYWYYFLNKTHNLPELNKENKNFSLPIKIWKRLPLSITKIIGPQIARALP